MKRRIQDLAHIIRSKNSGPFELTLDLFIREAKDYEIMKRHRLIDEAFALATYHLSKDHMLGIVYFDPARAIKITFARPVASGGPEDTDVYGAQQHMPLFDAEIEWPPEASS